MNIILVIMIAVGAGLFAKKMHIPAAFMLAAIFTTAFLNIIKPISGDFAHFKIIAQTLTGTYIGTRMSVHDFRKMHHLVLPSLVSVASLIAAMLVSGLCLVVFFDFDIATALLSSVPGGVSDISLMAYDFNADATLVTLFQTSRLCFVLLVIPLVVNIAKDKAPQGAHLTSEALSTQQPSALNFILTVLVGALGGALGYFSHFPAGTLSGSMLAIIVFHALTNRGYAPMFLRYIAQVLSGILVGAGVSLTFIEGLGQMILPLLLVLIIHLANNLLNTTMLAKWFHLDWLTCLFSTAPAGSSDMVLIATDASLGDHIDKSQIIFVHLVRLFLVLTLFPVLIEWLIILF